MWHLLFSHCFSGSILYIGLIVVLAVLMILAILIVFYFKGKFLIYRMTANLILKMFELFYKFHEFYLTTVINDRNWKLNIGNRVHCMPTVYYRKCCVPAAMLITYFLFADFDSIMNPECEKMNLLGMKRISVVCSSFRFNNYWSKWKLCY